MPPETADRIVAGVTVTTVDTTGAEVSGLDMAAGIAVPIVFVGLFMISIFITSGYLLQSVTEEKENRVVEIVLSSIPSHAADGRQDPGPGRRRLDPGGGLGGHGARGPAAAVEPACRT